MKYGVIDIGSNSVRLMISENGITIFKKVKITGLATDLVDGFLSPIYADKTANAIIDFIANAKSENVDKIFAFGTAAMRYAKNSYLVTDKVKKATGIIIDIIDGETEGKIGFMGAISGDGGIIDIGGASSEIVVVKNGEKKYSYSLALGCVSLTNNCGENKEKIIEQCIDKIKEYGVVPKSTFFGIGGTITTCVSLIEELSPYNPKVVDGYILKREQVKKLMDKLLSLTLEEREKLKGVQIERAKVIHCGSVLLYKIMEYLDIDSITVSEKDNLEGYLKLKLC